MPKEKKLRSKIKLCQAIRLVVLVLTLLVLALFVLFFFNIFQSNLYVEYSLLAIILVFILLEIFISFFLTKIEKENFFKDLYMKTLNNYSNLANVNFNLERYSSSDAEYELLNKEITNIENKYKDIVFYKKSVDFKDLKLDYKKYEDRESEIITKESFISNIPNFIDESFAFRNAFLTIRFSNETLKINYEEATSIAKKVNEVFSKNKVVIGYRDDFSLFVFIRNIDSIESFDYLLNYLVRDYHVLTYSLNSSECYTLKVSAVVYPYSSEKDILNDLYFVNKKTNPVDIFIPERLNTNKGIESQVERLSYLSKLCEEMTSVGDKVKNDTNFKDNFLSTIKHVGKYFDYDVAGFIENKYMVKYEVMEEIVKDGSNPVFNKKVEISKDFIETILKYKGKDQSIFFTSRNNVNPELAKYFDTYHITSGFFYVVYLNEEPIGLLYFCNRDKEIFADFLDREFLFFYSVIFRSYYNKLVLMDQNNENETILRNLLKITSTQLYSVRSDELKLISVCDSLKSYKNDIKLGDYCYKAIYGLDAQCKDCPIKTNHSKESTFDKERYISSLKLTSNKEKLVTMLMEPVKKDELIGRERFDTDLFISAYYPFLQSLTNRFDSKSKGYVVLCRLDNINEVLPQIGAENYNIMLRDIVQKINELFSASEIYLYNSNTLAFIFNEKGLSTVYDNCEEINHVIKHVYNIEGMEIRLIPNIFIYSYPLDFDNVFAYIRYIELNLNKVKPNTLNKLYAIEQHVERFASKTDYTMSLLEKASSDKNFELEYFPVFSLANNSLVSAIVTLKIKDNLRGTYINQDDTNEIIAKEGKMFEYTCLIMTQISNAFIAYDPNAFRVSGLDNFTIRIDKSFFNNLKSFADKLASLIQKLSFTQGFISFMLDEEDFSKSLDTLSNVTKSLYDLGIKVVLSSYTGNFISLSKCGDMLIKQVELKNALIDTLVDNTVNLAIIQKLTKEAKAHGISVIAPSIINADQEKLLKESNISYVCGSYYEEATTFEGLTKLVKKYKK